MSLQLAIDAAFDGPDAQNLDILGHAFDVKKMRVLQFGATTVANGEIFHCCKRPPHEQVIYFLKVFENRLIQSSRRVEYSEWPASLASVAPPWVGAVDHFLALVAQRLIADQRIDSTGYSAAKPGSRSAFNRNTVAASGKTGSL